MEIRRGHSAIRATSIIGISCLLISACSGDTAETDTAREAGASDAVTLCINNATGGPLGGDAENSTYQGGSFVINSGQELCFDQLPSSNSYISLSMMGEYGPQGWTVGIRSRAVGSGFAANAVACGDYVFTEPTPRDCNSNQYLISATKADGTKKFTVTIADA